MFLLGEGVGVVLWLILAHFRDFGIGIYEKYIAKDEYYSSITTNPAHILISRRYPFTRSTKGLRSPSCALWRAA